jgi:hypothetical protein
VRFKKKISTEFIALEYSTIFPRSFLEKEFHRTFNGPNKFHSFVERFNKTATLVTALLPLGMKHIPAEAFLIVSKFA